MIAPTEPTLVVAPHLDDAVLSAFAFLTRGTATVLTVFCGSPHDGRASTWDVTLGQNDGAEAMRTRLAEDDAALAELNVPTQRLPLLEAGYRSGALPAESAAAIADAVRAWTRETGGVVLAPAGAGARNTRLYRARWRSTLPLLRVPGGGEPHVDHVAVRDVVARTVLDDEHRLGFYEELPYLWTGRGDARVGDVCTRLGGRALQFHLPVDVHAKSHSVAKYSSQTPELFRPWVRDLASVLPERERYWLFSR